jgi:hypothetical protein
MEVLDDVEDGQNPKPDIDFVLFLLFVFLRSKVSDILLKPEPAGLACVDVWSSNLGPTGAYAYCTTVCTIPNQVHLRSI